MEEKVLFRPLPGIPNPVLYSWDVMNIEVDSGQQVRARIREHRGEKKLQLTAPVECSDAVFLAAKQQALDFIQFNSENPQSHGWTTHTVIGNQ